MKKLKLIDMWILIPYIILLGIGVVMVYSASFYNAMMLGGSTTQYLIKQGLYALLGLILCLFVFMLKVRVFQSSKLLKYLLIFTIFPLIYLLVRSYVHPSSNVNGASAWISIFGLFNFQPLELAKLVLILYLSYMLTKRSGDLVNRKGFFDAIDGIKEPVFLVGITILLVILEPDFGGAAILSLITLVLISSSAIPGKYIAKLNLTVIGFVGALVTLLLVIKPAALVKSYQYQRILALQHPFQLEKTSGAQLVNSFYAISNGGIFGVGLGNSIQKRGYLPEPHTDFIMAIISEELGLVGVMVVLGLLSLIIFRMVILGIKSTNTYNSLIYYGVATMLIAQIILNVGGLIGFIPLTGVTLPFISYGGSSMLILSLSLGIVLNIEATHKFSVKKHR